jgi:FKBP-type peptidyl-prolyl cis-trans isomerase 2
MAEKTMAEKHIIAENDFIEIDYTGRTGDDQTLFDTTIEAIAKQEEIGDEHAKYGSVIICVGEGQLLKGLDRELIGKEIGQEYTITLTADEAFGRKSAKLIQLVSTSKFIKQRIQPMPGLQVNIDGMTGIIKTVTGGRTMVDFNHPLAGRDIVYTVQVKRLVIDDNDKAKSLLSLMIPGIETELNESILTVKTKVKLPDELHAQIEGRVKKLVPAVTKVTFVKP